MNIVAGNVVRGDDFFDREKTIDDLWLVLQTSSVLLAAPRRVGKTSIMHRLLDRPRRGFKVVFLDGQDYLSPGELVADLLIKIGELRRDVAYFFRKKAAKAAERVGELEVWRLKLKFHDEHAHQWRQQGERAVQDAVHDGSKLLIVVDELPLMLHKMMQRDGKDGSRLALDLLDWLRHLRTDPRFNTNVRQLLGGSVGLPRIASALGGSAKVNDLTTVPIPPFTPEQARELVARLLASRGVRLDVKTMDAFLEQVGTFIPVFVQIMAAALASEVRERCIAPTPELVRECYEKRALGPEYRITFEDYYERLSRYYALDEAKAAERILRELALSDCPVTLSTIRTIYQQELGTKADGGRLDLLLTWLADDFYISCLSGDAVTFQSRWVRDWWRRYHAIGR